MRSHLTRKTIPWTLAAALVLAATGCGDDAESASTTTAKAPDPAESDYCREAIEWAIHEMTPFDDTDPVAFRAYWAEYTAFTDAASEAAPPEIEDQWQVKLEGEVNTVTPILEKYDFDQAAMMEQGTPEEEAAFEAPPEVQAAQHDILTYESEVCGAQQPEPADVSYDGEEPGPYCELVAAQDERNAAVFANGADPVEVEAFADELAATSAEKAAAAPAAIKDDVVALSDWENRALRDALESHGWAFEGVLADGSPEERAAVTYSDEEIREQFARVVAYEEQVCGA